MESFINSSVDRLTDPALLQARDRVLDQMAWTRQYSLKLIESIPHELWYQFPGTATTNVAWQVGHLAVSQYGLMLFRQRGRAAGDLELMPGWLRKQFGRGTQPMAFGAGLPEPPALLERLAAIDAQAHREVPQLTAEQLRTAIDMPYAAYPIQLGALLFCPVHEGLHAGQIGLLRRLHGLAPLR